MLARLLKPAGAQAPFLPPNRPRASARATTGPTRGHVRGLTTGILAVAPRGRAGIHRPLHLRHHHALQKRQLQIPGALSRLPARKATAAARQWGASQHEHRPRNVTPPLAPLAPYLRQRRERKEMSGNPSNGAKPRAPVACQQLQPRPQRSARTLKPQLVTVARQQPRNGQPRRRTHRFDPRRG